MHVLWRILAVKVGIDGNKNGARLNICHKKSDRIATGLRRRIYGEGIVWWKCHQP